MSPLSSGARADGTTLSDSDSAGDQADGGTQEGEVRPRLGRYVVLGAIDSGGMASVYLAQASGPAGFEKLVALKRVHPHLSNQREVVEMFLDEARISARCAHPNICQVFEVGEEGDIRFLAMEYLHGEPLSNVIKRAYRSDAVRRSDLFPLIVARIVSEACEGLHSAHELRDARGELLDVVHRDANPRNLFVTYDGHVKVVDFGVAHASGRLHQTSHHIAKGKLTYMSPEQLTGSSLDRRTDVWALGVTLWEFLSRERLFSRPTLSASKLAILRERVPAPKCGGPAVGKLSAIVSRALEKRRENRYPTARLLADDLNDVIAAGGRHVGASDIADFMQHLFAKRKAEKESWIEAARSGLVRPFPTDLGADPSSELNPTTPLARLSGWITTRQARLLATLFLFFFVGVGMVCGWLWWRIEPPDELVSTSVGTVPAKSREGVHAKAAQTLSHESPRGGPTAPANTGVPVAARPPVTMARPPTRRRSEAVVPRSVSVVTPGGWADVSVDGREVGRTPVRLTLPPGHHRLRLRPFGRSETLVRVVRVPRTRRVIVPLAPSPTPE